VRFNTFTAAKAYISHLPRCDTMQLGT